MNDLDRTIATIALQQLVYDWAYDLDVAAGRGVASLVAADCTYVVGGEARKGRQGVADFYDARHARLDATPAGLPTLRHLTANLRVTEVDADGAAMTFNLIFFAGSGTAPHPSEVTAVSDVRMTFRREEGGWRIASFDSEQMFRQAA